MYETLPIKLVKAELKKEFTAKTKSLLSRANQLASLHPEPGPDDDFTEIETLHACFEGRDLPDSDKVKLEIELSNYSNILQHLTLNNKFELIIQTQVK